MNLTKAPEKGLMYATYIDSRQYVALILLYLKNSSGKMRIRRRGKMVLSPTTCPLKILPTVLITTFASLSP